MSTKAPKAKISTDTAQLSDPEKGPQLHTTILSGGISKYQINNTLLASAERLATSNLNSLFAENPNRAEEFSLEAAGIYLDYSKNYSDQILADQLNQLALEADLQSAIERMFNGEKVNTTENRAALHTALRTPQSAAYETETETETETESHQADIYHSVHAARQKMLNFAEQVRSGQCLGYSGKAINDIVVLGIGGSYLGPKLVCEALKDFDDSGLTIQFVASLDPAELLDALERVDSQRVLFMVSSKSFSTLETLENAKAAKNWLLSQGCPADQLTHHFVAATAEQAKAQAFGITESHIFILWDWVGGRYSLWSSVGLPIALAVGADNFNRLLDGAHQMDRHFRHTPFEQNMPVIMALLGIWHANYLGASAHAILPYSYRLRSLTEHLQQLDMESNGKGVTSAGEQVDYSTGPLILGGMGNNGQHAYYQLLHQGPERVPVDFILTLQPEQQVNGNHQNLLANGIAHSQALMQGQDFAKAVEKLQAKGYSLQQANELAPHLVSHGNQPSNALVVDRLSPTTLGALLALYEHKIFCQGVIWNLESFDQWGVELGKEMGKDIYKELAAGQTNSQLDASTQQLIDRYRHSFK